MKIYGRAQSGESELAILVECTLVADPVVLRELASFLYRCADSIEEQGEAFEHDEFESNEVVCPQIVVFNPSVVESQEY